MSHKITNNIDTAIGIDLGTTYCAVGVYINDKLHIIPNHEQGARLTPSYVAYPLNSKETYGKVAKDQSYKLPECTVFDAKRMIGRIWSDPILQKDIQTFPFDIQNVKGFPKIKIGNKTRFPQEVSAKLLSTFCRQAERHLDKRPGTIKKAVITVPAYFNEAQRRATIEAGEAAGIEVLMILNEPTAAAIAYMMHNDDIKDKTALIYDLGGGTFDVSIVKVSKNDVQTLGVDGDTHLGGQDFDQFLVEYCAQEFQRKEGINILEDKVEFRRPKTRLRLQCESVKQALSSCDTMDVDIQCVYRDLDMNVTITRTKLEALIKPLLEKTMEIVERAIKDAPGINSKNDIEDIILVGGSTRIPLVTSMLKRVFPGKPIKSNIDPDEAVAYGAAVQAAILNDKSGKAEVKVGDVTPISLGISVIRNGVDDTFAPIIPKNHPIPCEIMKGGFNTNEDNQTSAFIKIYQGENSVASRNEQLGEFTLEGIPSAKQGQEQLDVKMIIDRNGILTVTATCESNNSSKSLKVTDDRLLMDRDTIERLATQLKI